MRGSIGFLLSCLFVFVISGLVDSADEREQSCTIVSSSGEEWKECSPMNASVSPSLSLQRMKYNIGFGKQETWVYVEPPIHTFYAHRGGDYSVNENNTVLNDHYQRVPSDFQGRHCKFFNILTTTLSLYWDRAASEPDPSTSIEGQAPMVFVKTLRPLSTTGIMAFVGNRFVLQLDETQQLLEDFIVQDSGTNVFSLDVIENFALIQKWLPRTQASDEETAYGLLQKTLSFNRHYFRATGRSYLSRYGRPPPRHFIWPADYFGQTHMITSTETHFDEHLPSLDDIFSNSGHALSFSQYRPDASEQPMNLTLTVISCAPRVLEIEDFLSPSEADHLVQWATRKELAWSETGTKESSSGSATQGTRTSQNTWIARHESPVVNAIYRRAADVLRMDESQLRGTRSVAEPLQMVRYRVGEEYKAHYDFGYPNPWHADQPTRFATLLLYLNNVTAGGETSFPVWSNAETSDKLRIVPKVGKAALFYLQLPDGNMDEKSIHEALPVLEGEKYLANMWIWDPYVDVASLK